MQDRTLLPLGSKVKVYDQHVGTIIGYDEGSSEDAIDSPYFIKYDDAIMNDWPGYNVTKWFGHYKYNRKIKKGAWAPYTHTVLLTEANK